MTSATMLKLPEPFPAGSTRPSKFGFYCYREDGAFMFRNFAATYAARSFLDTMINDQPFKFLDEQTILLDNGIKIKGEQPTGIEDVLEHRLTPKEREWIMPIPMSRENRIFAKLEAPRTADTPKPTPKAKREKVERTPRAPKDPNLIPLAQICEDMKISPKDARTALRASKTPKPDAGWAFAKNEVDAIKKVIKKHLKVK